MTTTGEAVSGESAGEVAERLDYAIGVLRIIASGSAGSDAKAIAQAGLDLATLGADACAEMRGETPEPAAPYDADAFLASSGTEQYVATLAPAPGVEVERLRAQVERQAHNIAGLLGAVETAAKARLATEAEVKRLRPALAKINNIRNSIIGLQTMDWSEHIYPLVAALEEAGIHGMEYPEAQSNYGTMLQRAVAAEDELAALRASPASPDDGWRSMDSAPRDATDVDLWVIPHDAFANGSAGRIANAFYRGGEWRRLLGVVTVPVSECGTPTHWRSPPSPPSAPETDEVAS